MATASPDGRVSKDDLSERLEELELQLSRKDAEISELKSSSISSVTQIQMLKDKIKAL
jgi:hypothetical protein